MFLASSKGNGGGTTLAFPDLCKTPLIAPPVPVPYPKTALGTQAKAAVKKVQAQSKTSQKKAESAQQELVNLLKKATAAFAKIEGRHTNTTGFDGGALKEYANAMYAAMEVTQKLQALLFQAASVTTAHYETKRQVAVTLSQQGKSLGGNAPRTGGNIGPSQTKVQVMGG